MNAEKRRGFWKTTLINTAAIVGLGGSALIFKNELKEDLVLIALFILIAYFLGQFSAIIILSRNNRINKQAEQIASVPDTSDKSGS